MDAVLGNIWVLMSCCGHGRQIKFRPPIPAATSEDFFDEYNNTSQYFTSSRNFLRLEKSLYRFHCLYIFKTNGTGLTDESVDFCLHFLVHVTSQAFERVLSVC